MIADPLAHFHPLVRQWFSQYLGAPTEVQIQGWAALRENLHTLLCAPTGSGKTLAAFLTCIDQLFRAGLEGTLSDQASVVYVSPLKALSNDIRKNLEQPLREMADLASSQGLAFPEIRIATRTGDTPAKERLAWSRRPPHIWITTPESLYILLGSESGRRGLSTVHTLILDEIHAVADDKRGAHLALSIERLEALVGRPLTRIGCSATVHPLEEVARLLVGTSQVDADGVPRCRIVDTGFRRTMNLSIHLPTEEIGPIATHAVWKDILDQIGEVIQAHRSTLVFVNTRRLVERVAHQLSERLGEDQVVAHHGSLSRATRLNAEEKLKTAQVKVCVATASLELGIDVGTVDVVCHIGSPRSVSIFLQRVGRSGHSVSRTPIGRVYPLTRDELVECVAILQLVRAGILDRLEIPVWPMDVLAQQVVAECAVQSLSPDAVYALVTRAWPYRGLPREKFDQVMDALCDGYAPALGRKSAFLHRDVVNDRVKGRRGAALAALTSGGAIPDNADYDVIADPEGLLVGRIHEDFAIESLAGDVFLLGNSSWRVRRVERGVVRVEDAQGLPPTIPFWLGEAPARTLELSGAVGTLREEVDLRLEAPEEAMAYLMASAGVSVEVAREVVAYVLEGKRVLGTVPGRERIVAERFFDESGGMQLVIHAPFGGRINRAWGMALRKSFCRSFDFELQAAATDDGINLSVGPQHSFPLEDIFRFVSSHRVEEVLTQAVLQSPLFTTRWRWTLTRSLAILRFRGGKRVPPPIVRMRSDDMLAAVFPAQAGCQDNRQGEDVTLPDHPLIFETMRDCLHEALDLDGLRRVLQRIEEGSIELAARDTPQPSVFSHQILNAMPYAFLDDAPLEERRARAVSLRRALPEDSRDLGRLDPEAIAAAREDAWPGIRNPDELHEALLSLILIPDGILRERWPDQGPLFLELLAGEGRVCRLPLGWCAVEKRSTAEQASSGEETALLQLLRGWAEAIGPFHVERLARELSLPPTDLNIAAHQLEGEGILLRGDFTGGGDLEWCDRRILSRIHRATVNRLRREIEPVPVSEYLRFLTTWQQVSPSARGEGPGGLLEAIGMLQGFEAALVTWESDLLPARIKGYKHSDLDTICLSGQAVWGRFASRSAHPAHGGRKAPMTRVAPISFGLREDLGWLLDPRIDPDGLSSRSRVVFDQIRADRASFASDLVTRCRLLPSELDDALGELLSLGLVSCDGFSHVRRLAAGGVSQARGSSSRFQRRPVAGIRAEGRWYALEHSPESSQEGVGARAAQLLRRYGILCRDLLVREPGAPPWRDLVDTLRKAEFRGEIRGGRFLAGVGGIQFALPEAIAQLRKQRKTEAPGEWVGISACDPLNLAGILTPGPKVTASPGNRLVLKDGLPVAWLEADQETIAASIRDELEQRRLRDLLHPVTRRPGRLSDEERQAAVERLKALFGAGEGSEGELEARA